MAPRSSRAASGADTDTSMADTSEPIRQLPVDPMVSNSCSDLEAGDVEGAAIIPTVIWLLLSHTSR